MLAVVVVAVLAVAFLVGGGWYFAGQIRSDALIPDHSPPQLPLEIRAFQSGSITLHAGRASEPALAKPLLDAVVWPTGTRR